MEDYKISIDFFCDNNKALRDKTIRGIQYISPEDLLKINGQVVVIIAVSKNQDIFEQLLAMGIKAENIVIANADTFTYKANDIIMKKQINFSDFCRDICSIADILEDELSLKILYQTFRKYIFDPREKIDYTGEAYFISELGKRERDVIVDVGAYNGDTLESYLKADNGPFDKYHAFEIDTLNYENLCNKVSLMSNSIKKKVVTYNLGLWSERAEVNYVKDGSSSNVGINGECKGFVDRLDNILKEKITFLKMDIEGAEINALEGCMQLIRTYKPICAISIYHSINDFIKIPIMLKELGYKIIIRHHDIPESAAEIVCYAYE